MANQAQTHDIDAIVGKMSRLARLSFSPAEQARFAEKTRAVLSYVEQLRELDTDGILPTSHAVEAGTGLRDDAVLPSGIEEPLMAAAPACDGPFLQVPRVIDSE